MFYLNLLKATRWYTYRKMPTKINWNGTCSRHYSDINFFTALFITVFAHREILKSNRWITLHNFWQQRYTVFSPLGINPGVKKSTRFKFLWFWHLCDSNRSRWFYYSWEITEKLVEARKDIFDFKSIHTPVNRKWKAPEDTWTSNDFCGLVVEYSLDDSNN